MERKRENSLVAGTNKSLLTFSCTAIHKAVCPKFELPWGSETSSGHGGLITPLSTGEPHSG